MLAAYPEVFAAGSVVAGLSYRCATSLIQAGTCQYWPPDRPPPQWGDLVRAAHPGHPGPRPRVAVWQGRSDHTVVPANAGELRDQFTDVLGIPAQPASTSSLPAGTTLEVYGADQVRLYRVAGMGHGTPVDPGPAADQCGTAAAYFLDTICSAYRDALFFGLGARRRCRSPALHDRRPVGGVRVVADGRARGKSAGAMIRLAPCTRSIALPTPLITGSGEGREGWPTVYGQILRIPGTAAFFGATAVGRLGVSMYGLSVILAGVDGYGDYVRAGIIGGIFAAGEAVGGPLVGRVVDRRGQRATLPLIAAVHVVAMAGLIAALSSGADLAAASPAAMLAGLSVPQLGALAAARWSRLLHGDRKMDTAMSLESLANDVAFVAGPLAASTAVAVLPATAGLAVAGALVGSATVLLASQRRTMPTVGAPTAATARGLPAARRIRALVLTLGLVNLLLGLLFGTTQLAVAALARADGAVGLAGAYYLTMSVGSLIASAGYGLITWRTPAWRRLAGAGALIATGGLAMVLLDRPAVVVAALFAVGLGVGPIIILTGTLIERHVGTARLTQSLGLMGALSAAGIALSGLVGGAAVETTGHAGGFLMILGYGVALCLVSLVVRGLGVVCAR